MEKINWQLGDLVKMRKQHPCGGFIWEILRIGMDFRLRCLKCGRIVLLPRQYWCGHHTSAFAGSGFSFYTMFPDDTGWTVSA